MGRLLIMPLKVMDCILPALEYLTVNVTELNFSKTMRLGIIKEFFAYHFLLIKIIHVFF